MKAKQEAELLARVFALSIHKIVRSFKMPSLGWSEETPLSCLFFTT
jgi:hypothetical protein